MTAPTPYSALRRGIAAVIAALLFGSLFQMLRIDERVVWTTLPSPAAAALADRPVGADRLGASSGSSDPAQAPVAAGRPADAVRRSGGPRSGSGASLRGQPAPSAKGPGPLHPPASGSYAYAWTINGQVTKGSLIVAAMGVDRRTETIPSAGGPQVDVVDWAGGSRTVTRTVFADGSPCSWTPTFTSLRGPLAAGETWHVNSTCETQLPDGSETKLQESEDVKVDGLAQTTLGGQPQQVWVIERHLVLTESSQSATATSETQSTELFSPSSGLIVYRVARTASPTSARSTAITTVITQLLESTPMGLSACIGPTVGCR